MTHAVCVLGVGAQARVDTLRREAEADKKAVQAELEGKV